MMEINERFRSFSGMRILITGISGFIGSYTAAALLRDGAEIYGLVRPSSIKKAEERLQFLLGDTEVKKIRLIPGDMKDILHVGGMPERLDAVLHFAWDGVNRQEIDDEDIHSKNAACSLELLRLASEHGAELFMDAGSRVEYGIKEDGRMEEGMDCHPINAYGRNKLRFYEEARRLCKSLGMSYLHLRFFSVYGIGDHPWSIISTLTRELPLGHDVELSACMHRWNFMDVRDASEAVVLLLKHRDLIDEAHDIVNIASVDTRVLREFTEEIYELAGRRGSLSYGKFIQAKEGALSICPVTERLEMLTDHEFREEISFSEGIKELISFNEHQGGPGSKAEQR